MEVMHGMTTDAENAQFLCEPSSEPASRPLTQKIRQGVHLLTLTYLFPSLLYNPRKAANNYSIV